MDLIKLLKESLKYTLGVLTVAFAIVPESYFSRICPIPECAKEHSAFLEKYYEVICPISSRVIVFLMAWVLITLFCFLFHRVRCRMTIKGENYSIRIEYGNILKKKKCKRVIPFDESFTTDIGDQPGQIKASSICGQYLKEHRCINLPDLIEKQKLKPLDSKSRFEEKIRYQSGSMIPYDNDLLMAFAELDERGKGVMTRESYLKCLSVMWEEIDNYYAQHDVCIPVLGAGITRFESASGASYSPQELLDLMVLSYKLSSCKIKAPYKLRIISKRKSGISLDRINV